VQIGQIKKVGEDAKPWTPNFGNRLTVIGWHPIDRILPNNLISSLVQIGQIKKVGEDAKPWTSFIGNWLASDRSDLAKQPISSLVQIGQIKKQVK
jgi:hypothetical protein